MVVVLCRPREQLQSCGVDDRELIEPLERSLETLVGKFGWTAAMDDADHAMAPEGDAHPLALSDGTQPERWQVVESAPQRYVQRDFQDLIVRRCTGVMEGEMLF